MYASGEGRVLTLCADDFGLSSGISRGIAMLARAQRLSAVSCITNAPHWREAAPLLRELPATVTVGLHFNLTEGQPLSRELAREWPTLPSLPRLLLLSHLHQLPVAALRVEWQAQLDAFVQATGRAPQMVDGHQHVHHLPALRQVVLDGIAPMAPRPAVRNTARLLGPGFAFKRFVIEHTGGRALKRELVRRGLRHNAALLGAYDFVTTDYRRLMRQWLAEVPPEGGLLFCHPAEVADAGDAIGDARLREFAYLEGNAFAADLAEAKVTLGAAWVRA
ncbi:MAG: ChbG/HpnK family deacetylase [Cytophagales bacterium]|nr:ChbG/HpnK family deacetylase [Rhizobacter sp.]